MPGKKAGRNFSVLGYSHFSYLFTDILSAEQQEQLKRPVICWGWQDRDGHSVWITGRGNIPKREEVVKQLDFSDSQYEKFMCLCDAKRFVAQIARGKYLHHKKRLNSGHALRGWLTLPCGRII
jgi:hypothetical protein